METTKYLTCTETARLLRAALKAAFPGTKFSVRSSSYSMGASIDVSWIGGPDRLTVERVADKFAGATFDGMTDSKSYHESMIDGETVSLGADFVHCSRLEEVLR